MKLDEKSFLIYAAKYYDMKQAASIDEFYDDLKRFQYLKRLFKRYEEENELRVRLILNHLIVLYNCFGPEATPMLFMKLDDYHHFLKPFVLLLNFLPEYIEYDNKRIKSDDVNMDAGIVKELREIL